MPTRAIVRLGFDCDNACVFCGQEGMSGSLAHSEDLLAQLRDRHDEISFVGGEPTLDDRLPGLIAQARALGFTAIGVQTNGRRLASEAGLFDALVDAGLSDIHLSIHGPSAAAHDYHTGRGGGLASSIAVIDRAVRREVTVVVTTVITRSNFRELTKLPSALRRHGVDAWLLEPVRCYGRAADGFARVVPRFGMALPWALHALEQARRHSLSAWIRGAPLCALGPFAASALPAEPRSYAPQCDACPARPRCPGVDAAYLEVFGGSELRPGAVRPPAAFDEGRERLIRMFVGVGELVERPPQLRSLAEPAPDEPSPGKHRLPVVSNTPDPRVPSGSNE